MMVVAVVVGAWREEFDLQTYAPTPHSVGLGEMGFVRRRMRKKRRRRRRRIKKELE